MTRWWYAATSPDVMPVTFWVRDDHVLAGMNVNVWDVTDAIQTLIQNRVPIDPAAGRPTVPFDDLGGRAG